MKFRRKSRNAASETEGETTAADEATSDQEAQDDAATDQAAPDGPYDDDEVPDGVVDDNWVDLGSLLVAPAQGKELRLQVDEASGNVGSVLIAAQDGAMEVRAFAAPRAGDLWAEALPLLREDIAKRGGKTTDREGPWGPELVSQMQVQLADGQQGVQVSRMIGINGPRWMLRATLLGRPAVEEEYGAEWEAILRSVVVRRGTEAKPKGEALPVTLPPQARRVQRAQPDGQQKDE